MSRSSTPDEQTVDAILASDRLLKLIAKGHTTPTRTQLLAAWQLLTDEERTVWTRLHNLDGRGRTTAYVLADTLDPPRSADAVYVLSSQINELLTSFIWPQHQFPRLPAVVLN